MGCCCRKGSKGDAPVSAKGKKGKKDAVDGPAEKISTKFLGAFDQTFTAEDAIRNFLQENLYKAYEAAFITASLAERSASLKAKDDKKNKAKGKTSEIAQMPQEPAESRDTKKGMLKWEKYEADRKAYEDYGLSRARRANIEVGAEVVYPEELQYLRPISEKTGKPLRVLIATAPADTSKAKWTDELKQLAGQSVDAKIRKDKKMMPKFKGLSDRCFDSVKEDLVTKLMHLCKEDDEIWKGVSLLSAKTEAKMKAKLKKPAEPKGLSNPLEMFREGKDKGKYEEYDDDGVPTKKKGGKELKDAETKALKKQWEQAKKTWDKHQESMETYNTELQKWNDDNAVEVEESKKKWCSIAGKSLVARMIEDLIAKRADELITEVNKGIHDAGELLEIVVTEKMEEEEIITDPVLKAFRRFDEEATNACNAGQLTGIFSALGEDELEQGTHKFYSEVSEEELKWIGTKLSAAGVETDGNLNYMPLKTYIEAEDVPILPAAPPMNLVSCLVAMKIEKHVSSVSSMEFVYSPRTWRAKIAEEFGNKEESGSQSARGKVSPRSKEKKKTSTSKKVTSPKASEIEEEAGEEPVEEDGKKKKDKKEKKDDSKQSEKKADKKEKKEDDGKKEKKEKKSKK